MSKSIFILENLNCANCASKIEAKINKLPQIESAVFTFTTKKLVVESILNTHELAEIIQKVCDSIEDGVIVREINKNLRHSHSHEEEKHTCECSGHSCGHNHEHEHNHGHSHNHNDSPAHIHTHRNIIGFDEHGVPVVIMAGDHHHDENEA